MEHPIDISVVNNSVGIPQSSDGIMQMFIQAVAVAGTFVLDQAYLLTGMDDLDALGIDADYDVTNGTAVFQQVNEFYEQAGDGTLLWLVGVPIDTAYAAFVASDTFDALLQFTGAADPANRAKMIGLCYAPPAAAQNATDFPGDIAATQTALQTKLLQLFQQGIMVSAILDGYNMSSAVTPATLGSQATNTAYYISLCITGTQPNGVSAVGLALGRFARISVGHGFGAVKDGSIDTTTAYLTNSVIIPPAGLLVVGTVYTVFGGVITYNAVDYNPGEQFTAVNGHTNYSTTAGGYVAGNVTPVNNIAGTSLKGLSPTSINQLGQKQYMFIRTWFDQSGLYWNDGATCNPSTKALSSQEYCRVINKLSAEALSFFIQEMGQNLPVDVSTGAVEAAWLTGKQQEFYDTYIAPLNSSGGTGDISDATLVVTGDNFLATKTLKFTLSVVPSVILGGVTGTVQFVAKL